MPDMRLGGRLVVGGPVPVMMKGGGRLAWGVPGPPTRPGSWYGTCTANTLGGRKRGEKSNSSLQILNFFWHFA